MAKGKKPKKTATETARPKLVARPDGRGALLTGGVPGNKGGPGRPANEFRQALLALVDKPKVLEHLQGALESGPDDKGDFWQAVKYCTDQGAGKAPETKVIEGGDKPLTLKVEVTHVQVTKRG